MSKHLKRARTGAIVLAAVCALGLMISLAVRSGADASYLLPSSDELAVGLHRVGLGPAALTAAGLSTADVADAVDLAAAHLSEHGAVLDQAQAEWATAKRTRHDLARRVRAGRASQQEVQECQTARTTLQAAESTLDAELDALHDAATAESTASEQAILAQIRQNQRWKLPVEFLTVSRSEADWVALRDALDNERIAARRGIEPDSGHQALLAAARSNPTVSQARANLNVNLANNTVAWEGAVADP